MTGTTQHSEAARPPPGLTKVPSCISDSVRLYGGACRSVSAILIGGRWSGSPGRSVPACPVPGTGRAHRLADILDVSSVELDASKGLASFSLTGTERGWSTVQAGRPLDALTDGRVANPLVIIGKVDKAGPSGTTARASASFTPALPAPISRGRLNPPPCDRLTSAPASTRIPTLKDPHLSPAGGFCTPLNTHRTAPEKAPASGRCPKRGAFCYPNAGNRYPNAIDYRAGPATDRYRARHPLSGRGGPVQGSVEFSDDIASNDPGFEGFW